MSKFKPKVAHLASLFEYLISLIRTYVVWVSGLPRGFQVRLTLGKFCKTFVS